LKGFRSHFVHSPFLDFSWRYRDELSPPHRSSPEAEDSLSRAGQPSLATKGSTLRSGCSYRKSRATFFRAAKKVGISVGVHTVLGRADVARSLTFVAEPRKIPVVLSPEEVARFLEAAPGVKYKAAFSVAYGAGLRVSEVASLKVSDIDSERMLLRIEQGKGRKDRYAMLSPVLLELLRDWWRIAQPKAWLFTGQDPLQPISTRQLNRACHAAAHLAEITKRVSPHTLRHSFATHLLEQNTDIRVIQVLLGHAKVDTTALYTRIATNTIRAVMSPLERLSLKPKRDEPPA